jgi:uncharacterized protein
MKPTQRLLWPHAAILGFSLLLSSCAATPPIRFHSLLAIEGSARPLSVAQGLPIGFAVTLAAVTVPPQVDQPQWLLRNADGTLGLLEQERWVAPLRGELQSAVLDRWINAWGGRAPSAAGAKENAWRVTIDVTRWDAVPGREVRLESRWSASSGVALLTCRSVIREATLNDANSPILALADSHRRAVLRLADEVASRIAELQKSLAARCAEASV